MPPRRYLAPCPLEPGLSSAARKDHGGCLADSRWLIIIHGRRSVPRQFQGQRIGGPAIDGIEPGHRPGSRAGRQLLEQDT